MEAEHGWSINKALQRSSMAWPPFKEFVKYNHREAMGLEHVADSTYYVDIGQKDPGFREIKEIRFGCLGQCHKFKVAYD